MSELTDEHPKVPLAAFKVGEKPEVCECPQCGRTHWKMNFGIPPNSQLVAIRARVAQLEAALCKISTACRKDTSLSPKDHLLEFVVGVVDAALTQPAELEESK